jgi:hypothetical protein
LQPFAHPFMALFGRERLPHRSTERPLSRRTRSSVGRGATHAVSRRSGSSASGEGGESRGAVGPARGALAGLRCRWYTASGSPTSLALHP